MPRVFFTFQPQLQFLVLQTIHRMLAQMVSKCQHSGDLHVTFTANMELVSANTIDVALEEMVARGQIASAPISQHFKRLAPILYRAS